MPYSWRPKVGLTLTYGSLFVKTVYHSQAELQALFATICDNDNAIGAGGVYHSLPWIDGKVKHFFAIVCVNDKGIWVGVGPLPWLVYQRFDL